MAFAIPALMIASAAIAAYGAIQQGQANKAAAKYNAAVNEQNAVLSRQEANDAAMQADRERYMRLGSIRAAAGKSGVQAQGSVLDVIGDAASQSELQRQQIIYRGELKARGYNNTATLDEFSGSQAQTAGYLKAGSALLSGASTYAGNLKRT